MSKKQVSTIKPAPAAKTKPGLPDVPGAKPDAIDVFVCIAEPNHDVNKRVIEAWQLAEAEGVIRLWVMTPMSKAVSENPDHWVEFFGIKRHNLIITSFGLLEFQRGRRVIAETMSKSPYYIVADGDCVPVSAAYNEDGIEYRDDDGEVLGHQLEAAAATMDRYKEFAILSFMPSNAVINPWTPEPDEYEIAESHDGEVMEHVDVGGIRVVRRGVMPQDISQWWPQDSAKYDRHHAMQIRGKGKRVGYFTSIFMEHLGERSIEA